MFASDDTRESLTFNSPMALFERLDAGDASHVRDLTVLLDLPEVVSVARFLFTSGVVGYEAMFSEIADRDDRENLILLVGHFPMIRFEPWGSTESGYMRFRALYIEPSPVRTRGRRRFARH